LERRGGYIHLNPRLLELSAHYHFAVRPRQVRAGNRKGRVERAIRYVRDSFRAGRGFTTLAECNRQAWLWRDQVAHRRRWPGADGRSGEQVFAGEQPRLLPLPLHSFNTDRVETVSSHKSIYVRFDLNDYSIPPEAVLQLKRKAFHATPAGRLEQAVPESKTLLDLAFAQGESAGSQTAQLLKLLDEYGPAALRRGVAEALERNTSRACSAAFPLRRQPRAPRIALDLSRHPEAQSIDVRPHDLETYDELARTQDDDPQP
jgi:hypothetical protein